MKIPIFDERIYDILSILGGLSHELGYTKVTKIVDEAGIKTVAYQKYLPMLKGLAVDVRNGAYGGYSFTGEAVTLGQVFDRLGLFKEVPDNLFTQRMNTQMKRLMRIKLTEYFERD